MSINSSETLQSLQDLHANLIALSANRLVNIDRLWEQLEGHIEAFRALLDKKSRNEQSRKTLETGNIPLGGEPNTVNELFQDGALQVANDLDLDELEAADLFYEVKIESEASGRSRLTCSVIRFQQRQKELLDCLRLILQAYIDVDQDDDVRERIQTVVAYIIQPPDTKDSSRFVVRCLSSMIHIKNWLGGLSAKLDALVVVNNEESSEDKERLEYQRVSLVKQHESLGVIIYYLSKNHAVVADFESILSTLKSIDRLDNLLLHYFPALSSYISRFGSQDGGTSIAEARALNERLLGPGSQTQWSLTYVHAAFRCWWLSEYSSWYGENYDGSLPQKDLDAETYDRSQQFALALKDGAFDFLLSLSADIKSQAWYDPARHALRLWLQRKAPPLCADSVIFSDYFQEILMEQLEGFIEGFITNLPDVLRKMRVNEDEQRQVSETHDHDLDLERFLVIISYAYDGRPKAALQAFWDVPDGACMGFLSWASRRASTPLVSAFCEMLQSISQDEECATAAHQFLLDEGPQSSGKARRNHSLTWTQITKELAYFCVKIRDRPSVPQPYGQGKPNNDLAELEPESFLMLECYLRVVSRLCAGSLSARQYLAQHPTFHVTELLLQLTSSSILSRVKACAFTTLRSLLSQKTKEAGEHIWTALDVWVSGGFAPGSSLAKTSASISASATAASAERILRGLGTGFEEPNAFIQLLCALVSPYDDENGLHDRLPFPEHLGGSSRMPGIEPYIDFALGQIFASQTIEITDVSHMRLLQLTCLDFIATCLDTFNEDLVIFANRSSIMVDSAIQTSSLKSYVLLHPFARVMEWMFNDKAMKALFAALHQNPIDVGSAEPDSPLILCILRGIHVISLILDFQPTYLNIVRPLVKMQPGHPRVGVANAAFASFEDGVLSHLFIVADLGLYCSTGPPELVIASLKLLEKLSASPKFASATATGIGRVGDRNKAISALEAHSDPDAVSRSLLHDMKAVFDPNQGSEHVAYSIKIHILEFLTACLKASPSQPTIAHLLLGFKCLKDSIEIAPNSLFSEGISLFHAILDNVIHCNICEEVVGCVSPWLVNFKHKALQVLGQLWQAPLSSSLVMDEMRAYQLLFPMFVAQMPINADTLFDGKAIGDSEFFLSPAVSCLSDFLGQRAITIQYVAAELQQVSRNHLPSLNSRIVRTLLGSTDEDGQLIENATIFDMFDFIDLEPAQQIETPSLPWFPEIDLTVCIDIRDEQTATLDLKKVRGLLLLRRTELFKANLLETPEDAAFVEASMEELISVCAVNNQFKHYSASRLNLLRSWVQLSLMVIKTSDSNGPAKTNFILRTLQTILPGLENRLDNIKETIELAKLAKALIFSFDFDSKSFKEGDMGDLVSDRLFHLYQVSLRAINSLGANPAVKEIFYNISYRYLTGMSDLTTGISGPQRRHSIKTIKAAGERFLELICDDAISGEGMCRISALLLLGAFIKMAEKENSKYIVESLNRLNFITILVDSIKKFADEFSDTAREYVHMQLSYCNARLALLLHISQTRYGASVVLNAGLFHAIKASGLFESDPDLGIDIDDPNSISLHYSLLTSLMRVICAIVLSRGPENEQTLNLGRTFLTDNKLSFIAVLKKSAGIGTRGEASAQSVAELADSYMLLMSITGFLDMEEATPKRPSLKSFT